MFLVRYWNKGDERMKRAVFTSYEGGMIEVNRLNREGRYGIVTLTRMD